jgi:hypothetical protein
MLEALYSLARSEILDGSYKCRAPMALPCRLSLRVLLSIVCIFTLSQILWWNRQTHLLDHQYHKEVVNKRYRSFYPTIQTTSNVEKPIQTISLAIVVAGSAQRLLFNSTVHHVIRPMTMMMQPRRQPDDTHIVYEVDYFAAITLQSGPAFRQESGYMGHLAYDPFLTESYPPFQNPKASSSVTSQDVATVQSILQQSMSKAITDISVSSSSSSSRAKLQALRVLAQPIEDSPILDKLRSQRRKPSSTNSIDDSWLDQFPMMDQRPQALERTKAGNKNMIRLFLLLESLWTEEVVVVEQRNGRRSID